MKHISLLLLSLLLLGACGESTDAARDLLDANLQTLKEQAEKTRYIPPEDGRLTAAQIEMYLAVRTRHQELAAAMEAELETKTAAEGDDKDTVTALLDGMAALTDMAEFAALDMRACKELDCRLGEYQWVRKTLITMLLEESTRAGRAKLIAMQEQTRPNLEKMVAAETNPSRRAALQAQLSELDADLAREKQAHERLNAPGSAHVHNLQVFAPYRDQMELIQTDTLFSGLPQQAGQS